jgi:hypothetical protein
MGARRFAPDTARFISSDFYASALSDLGLATDPLTANRYALAAGNPIGYVETDGHTNVESQQNSPDPQPHAVPGGYVPTPNGTDPGPGGGGLPPGETRSGRNEASEGRDIPQPAGDYWCQTTQSACNHYQFITDEFGYDLGLFGELAAFLPGGEIYEAMRCVDSPEALTCLSALPAAGKLFKAAKLASIAADGAHAAKGADEALGGVYSLRDEAGSIVRTGRTKDLRRRRGEHGRDPLLSEYRFQVEYRTDDYATQRGLEQLMHDEFVPALNKIRPISKSNPRIDDYLLAGQRFRNLW